MCFTSQTFQLFSFLFFMSRFMTDGIRGVTIWFSSRFKDVFSADCSERSAAGHLFYILTATFPLCSVTHSEQANRRSLTKNWSLNMWQSPAGLSWSAHRNRSLGYFSQMSRLDNDRQRVVLCRCNRLCSPQMLLMSADLTYKIWGCGYRKRISV